MEEEEEEVLGSELNVKTVSNNGIIEKDTKMFEKLTFPSKKSELDIS